MRLLGLDFETTGFDVKTERITEVGLAVWDTDEKAFLMGEMFYLNDDGVRAKCQDPEIVSMMKRVCGITPAHLEEFGKDPCQKLMDLEALARNHKIDYIVAHNGTMFDRPLLMAELDRLGAVETSFSLLRSLPWIDTQVDIPFEKEPDSRKLKYMATDHGFINPLPHRALMDVLTMLVVLSKYDIGAVLAYRQTPNVLLQAVVTYAENAKARNLGYKWNPERKIWFKNVKQDKVKNEQELAQKNGLQLRILPT